MPSVPAGACLGQSLATARRQRERVVQFAISEQSAIGGDHRTAEPKNQAAVETEPQRAPVRFTRRVRHHRPFDLAQHVVYYTIIRTIAPQNTVSSEESGLKCRSGARSAVPTGLAGYFHIFFSFAKKIRRKFAAIFVRRHASQRRRRPHAPEAHESAWSGEGWWSRRNGAECQGEARTLSYPTPQAGARTRAHPRPLGHVAARASAPARPQRTSWRSRRSARSAGACWARIEAG